MTPPVRQKMLDAVVFIWKQLGTSCENLPEAHRLIRAFNAVARIAAPALLFKSEAIVHPDEVLRYIAGDIQNMTGGRIDASILRQLLIALAMIGIMLSRPRGLWPAREHGKGAPAPVK